MAKSKDGKIEKGQMTDNEIRSMIGDRIKRIRNDLGFSAQTIATHLHISREAVSHIENGRNNVSATSLLKLATLFNCEVSEFFPKVPEGFELTQRDRHKLAREDEHVIQWAEQLFNRQG